MKQKSELTTAVTKLCFIVWSLTILILSVIPSVEPPYPELTYLDKIAHFGQYLVFSILYFIMRHLQGGPDKKILKELFILSLILPLFNEVIQLFVPGRTFCLLDIAANYLGFTMMIIYLKLRSIRKYGKKNEEH
jgi:VanZ family protein